MSTDEQKFTALQSDWRAIGKHGRAVVQRWNQRIAAMTAAEGALRDQGRWVHGRGDFLGVLNRQRDEVAHSRAIAWLLDPCGKHGLGTQVLTAVLQAASAPHACFDGLHRARVRCEVPIDQGRMDIVVESPQLYLVIENKVDAEEGDGQCDYYYERVTHPRRQFILLSPDGRPARTAGAFRPLSYSHFARIIETALAQTAPGAQGRSVAVDYLNTLKVEFP